MSRKRSQVVEEVNYVSKRHRPSKDTNSPVIENSVYYTSAEQKKKIEASWKKAKLKNQNDKEMNYKMEIDQIKKETHPIFLAQIEKLKREKERKFQLLEDWKEDQFRLIEESVEAGRKECIDEYEKNVKEVKDQLLTLANQDKKLVEMEMRNRVALTRKSVRGNILRNKGVVHSNDGSSIVQQIQLLSRLQEKELKEDMALIRAAIKEQQDTHAVVCVPNDANVMDVS